MSGLFRIRFQRLHVFENEAEIYIAYDEEDCEKAFKEFVGEFGVQIDDDVINDPFTVIKDNAIIRINFEEDSIDLKHLPLFAKVSPKNNFKGYHLVSAPAWAWILFNGRGFLCSDEW